MILPSPPGPPKCSSKDPDSQLRNQTVRGDAEDDCEDFVDIYPEDDNWTPCHLQSGALMRGFPFAMTRENRRLT